MQKERYVVFDFDGTISTLRCGWEGVMRPMMLEMLCPGGEYGAQLIRKVDEYIDSSTGIQTAYQMQWLAEEVKKATGAAEDVWFYKDCYNRRILSLVEEKRRRIISGTAKPEDFIIAGAVEFLRELKANGCRLFLASGTDDADVKEEARFLGVDGYFELIKGAPSGEFGCSKEQVMRGLIENAGADAEMTVFGDGKVEIMLGKELGAKAVGIASDEAERRGVDERKLTRLSAAGADAIFGDFTDKARLLELVMG